MKTPNCSLLRANLLLVLLVASFITISGQKTYNGELQKHDNRSFRYVIIENRLDEDANTGEKCRAIEVLLDKKAFSEKNLRALFSLVSRRFPDAELLDVWVHTSLDQAPTPEERDEGGTSGEPNKITKGYFWAVYFRNPDDEYFRYSPVNDVSGNKLIKLKNPKN